MTTYRLTIVGLGYILSYFAVLLVQLGLPNVFTILVISEADSLSPPPNVCSLLPAVLLFARQHVLSRCSWKKMGSHGRRSGHVSVHDGICSHLHGLRLVKFSRQ